MPPQGERIHCSRAKVRSQLKTVSASISPSKKATPDQNATHPLGTRLLTSPIIELDAELSQARDEFLQHLRSIQNSRSYGMPQSIGMNPRLSWDNDSLKHFFDNSSQVSKALLLMALEREAKSKPPPATRAVPMKRQRLSRQTLEELSKIQHLISKYDTTAENAAKFDEQPISTGAAPQWDKGHKFEDPVDKHYCYIQDSNLDYSGLIQYLPPSLFFVSRAIYSEVVDVFRATNKFRFDSTQLQFLCCDKNSDRLLNGLRRIEIEDIDRKYKKFRLFHRNCISEILNHVSKGTKVREIVLGYGFLYNHSYEVDMQNIQMWFQNGKQPSGTDKKLLEEQNILRNHLQALRTQVGMSDWFSTPNTEIFDRDARPEQLRQITTLKFDGNAFHTTLQNILKRKREKLEIPSDSE
ncbi:hypothetical protein BDY21DRAFT_381032 [Lineolata rhizophorae]|uniref:Uncharacterized protein n=1 Tax=Lineolata rhizophorae TaxID=578093 RepID=A0A6A6NUI9_9PEZI|nr:hypothetical protein BDY21DRAFT_381032 [Lineolata rhizophorae]